jgi:hypothetical protein
VTVTPGQTTDLPPEEITAEEAFESLTGFEEIAIGKHFDAEITDLAESRPMGYMRALVFVCMTRRGLPAPDAKSAALGLTIRQVSEFFAEDQPEVTPEEPETPGGSEGSPQPGEPIDSPPGVS